MKKLSPTALALTGGFLLLADFLLSFLWRGMIIRDTHRPLFDDMMTMMYPGYGVHASGILLGVVESFVFGLLLGYIVANVYNYFVKE